MTRENEDAQAEFLRTHPTAAKPSNPKDAFGSAKVPVGLAPDTALQEMALAFLEGATKYGRYNWRVVGVRASIYNDAMERHRMKWWNGQNRDPVTRVRELASVMACCAILIDSEICGVLEDDRPPMAPMGELLDSNMGLVAHLKELFKDHHPPQPTIADTPGLQVEGFPGGYNINAGDQEGRDPAFTAELTGTVMTPALDSVGQYPLTLDCGCVKRCKGHTEPNFRAAPVDIVVAGSPGNYAQERAQAAYVTTTADAEFPLAPPIHRAVESARDFDPAD